MNSSKHSLFSFAVVFGLVLWLASDIPVGAGWFSFPDQPHYSNWGQSQSLKPHRKSRREISSLKQGAQREQTHPQGPFQVIVAIASQQIAIYGHDGFIARAPISTGMPAHPTPTGVFTVIAKARWHASNIYSRAPMPYMQRITWSGIALHAGPRPGYPASHGCIRLPQDFAIRLFQMTKIGTRVIVTRDAVAPIEITHPKLFVPKGPTEHTAALASGAPSVSPPILPAPEHPSAASGITSDGNTTPVESKRAVGLSRPVSVFVSRKQGRVFVRQGFTELFDLPIKIDEPDRPIGTHIFTAMGFKDDGKTMRWTVVSVPSQYRHHVSRSGKGQVGGQTMDPEQVVAMPSTAAEALERIEWPPEAIDQISSLLIAGSSLIVSDNALSDETDADTDFIVLTP